MNGAYPHLLLNHIPIFGLIAGLALLAAGLKKGSIDLNKAGLVALVITALGSGAAFLTGEPAEEAVEHLPGVSHDVIEEHEGAALFALIGTGLTGALALFVLFRHHHAARIPNGPIVLVLVVSLIAAAITARTSLLGGEVRHTEVRSGAAPAEKAPSQ